jgi:hypothetical protein
MLACLGRAKGEEDDGIMWWLMEILLTFWLYRYSLREVFTNIVFL